VIHPAALAAVHVSLAGLTRDTRAADGPTVDAMTVRYPRTPDGTPMCAEPGPGRLYCDLPWRHDGDCHWPDEGAA
jgi:hypothetical protein